MHKSSEDINEREIESIKKVIDVLKNVPYSSSFELMMTIFEQSIFKQKIAESFCIFIKKENAEKLFLVYSSKNVKDKEAFENISYKSIKKRKLINENNIYAYPLFAKSQMLGVMTLKTERKNEYMDILIDYFSIVLYGEKTVSLANKDKLTGLFARSYALEKLKKYEEKKYLYSVIIIDLDRFKHYNDRYGHNTGDIVLKKTAKIMKESLKDLKPEHTLARYGGEEFIIIVRVYKEETLKIIMEKVRKNIESADFSTKDYLLKVTASLGGCIKSDCLSFDELIENADKALYKAKESGRNKSIIFKK